MKKITKLKSGLGFVETWYDKVTRNWVTQIKDNAGNQVGDAEYSGDTKSSEVAHEWAVFDAEKVLQSE